MKKFLFISFATLLLGSCSAARLPKADLEKPITIGVNRSEIYLPLLEGKRVGLLSNSTVIFSPEHGFRDFADAGEHVADMVDKETRIYIQSLYGYGKAGVPDMVDSVDVIVTDIQDVGFRYYT